MSDQTGSRPDSSDSLRRLIELAVNGQANHEQLHELEKQLVASQEARDSYLNYIHLHSSLSRRFLSGEERRPLDETLDDDLAELALQLSREGLSKSEARPNLWLRTFVVAIAASILIAVGYWGVLQFTPNDKPVIVKVIGQASIETSLGTIERADIGRVLKDQDLLTTNGAGTQVVLRYEDGTQVVLSGAAKLRVNASRTGKRLKLLEGWLHADVAPQPQDRPLSIATPHTSVRVLGTRFELAASEKAGTRLDLESGRVELLRTNQQPLAIEPSSIAIVPTNDDPIRIEPRPNVVARPNREARMPGVRSINFSEDDKAIVAATDWGAMYFFPDDRLEAIPATSRGRNKHISLKLHSANLIALEEKEPRHLIIWDTVSRSQIADFNRFDRLRQFKDPERRKANTASDGNPQLHIAALSPRGDWMTTKTRNSRVHEFQLHDLKRGRIRVIRQSQEEGWLSSFLPSPSGDLLAVSVSVIGRDRFNAIDLIDPYSGDRVGQLPIGKSHKELAMSFSQDGSKLAVGLNGELQIWNVERQELLTSIQDIGHYLSSVALSPDAQYVAAAGPSNSIRLWRVDDPSQLQLLEVGRNAHELRFSPDGRQLAALLGTQLLVWEVEQSGQMPSQQP